MKGIYCLLIKINKDIIPSIGVLGRILFKKGKYVYIGSAQNSIEKRLSRHFSKNKKIKWHIDYLLSNPNVKAAGALWKKAGKKEECKTASLLNKNGEAVKSFGCSDCRCYSHLFKLRSLVKFDVLMKTKRFIKIA